MAVKANLLPAHFEITLGAMKAERTVKQSPTFGEFSKEKTKNSKGKMEKFFSFRKKRQMNLFSKLMEKIFLIMTN